MGEAAQRLGQPAVMGQLIGGLLLGPSVLGLIWPAAQHALFPGTPEQKSMINAVSQLGILMLLLLTGMETDLQLVKRVGRAAVTVAAAGVALPFICGFALGEMLPDALLPKPDARLVTAIFLGTALSISSVKIVAMVVREMNFMRRDLGQIIVASAILEDTIGWVIIAVAFGLASAGTVDLWSLGRAVLGTAAFMAASLTVGRRIVFYLIRWTNDNFKSEFPVITVILLIMIAMALITQLIGVNTVLGAFVAGILIGESPILTRHIDEQLRGLIVALFMPVFFGLSGLSADLTVLKNPQLALLALGLIAIASVGKFLGAFVGGKLGGLTPRRIAGARLRHECARLDRGDRRHHRPVDGRAQPESVHPHRHHGDRDHHGDAADAALGAQAAADAQEGTHPARARRARRQELCDQPRTPAAGRRRQRQRQIRVPPRRRHRRLRRQADHHRRHVEGRSRQESRCEKPMAKSRRKKSRRKRSRRQPKASTRSKSHPDEEKPGNVDVTARSDKPKGPQAIAEEARKGYDFMVVGIAKTRNPNGGFSKDISLITNGFEGPLAVVDAHEPRRDRLPRRYGKILIPVNGTEVSRRAAEIGLTLARASDAQVTALFVTRANGGGGKANSAARKRATRRNEQAILKDIGALGDRYDVDVRCYDTREPGARGRDRPRSQARLRSRRARRQPAARRYAVFRRHRRVGARTLGYVKSICGELRRCDRIVIAESRS